jgi:hypothetical protein
MKKLILISLAAIVFCYPHLLANSNEFELSEEGKKAYAHLKSVERFIVGGLGEAPGKLAYQSEDETALLVLLDEKESEAALKNLVTVGSREGQLYALFGLHLKFPKSFDETIHIYRAKTPVNKKVTVQFGCEVMKDTIGNVTKSIETGYYDRMLKRETSEK